MNGQTILTNYFTASKSRQNTHPAKRRKVEVDIDVLPKKSAKLVDEKCVSSNQENVAFTGSNVLRSTASSRAKQGNRARTKICKTRRKPTQNRIASDGVVSVTTSLQDDHETERSRKQSVINNTPRLTEAVSYAAPAAASAVKTNKSESKIEQSLTQVPNKTSLSSKSAAIPANITSQSRTGLAINQWIAEQAKLVLASRGKQALERSLGKKKSRVHSPKLVEVKALVAAEIRPKVQKTGAVKPKIDVPRLSEGVVTTESKSASAESSSSLPAYKRFSHLLEAKKPQQPSGVTRNLPLPYHFKVLEEMFRCVDVVLSLKQKRYETCTFEKLKDAVQEMCRKKFEKKHLAQMKSVYPSAFVFRQQSSSCGAKKSGHELTIDFNLGGFQEQKAKDFKFIESSVLISRQKHFKNELLKITMSHHRTYLTKNYPSLSVDDNAIMRWHPCFSIDEVPEICLSPLPEPPQVKTFSTAQDVLDQARQYTAPRVEKALKFVAKKSAETNSSKTNCAKTIANQKDSNLSNNRNPSLKGISQSLIDKIRQKEEKKIEESLTVDSEVVKKRVMVQRLPELCRILKTYFVSERKAAIPLEDVNCKLAESCANTLSTVQVEKHVKLLSEVAPEWLSIMYVRKCPYVKVKKNINIASLIEKLKSKEVN